MLQTPKSISAVSMALIALVMAEAKADELSPRVFESLHHGQYGNFSHWSAVIERGKDQLEIAYAVCNLDQKTPLIYRWIGPNITVGEGGRLPTGKCHTVERPAVAVEHDRDAQMLFTQARRQYNAPAHLKKIKLPIPSGLLPRALTNKIRTFFVSDTTDAPNLADLVITQERGDGTIRHSLSWYPRTITIAVATNTFGDENADRVVRRVRESGYEARVSSLGAAIADPGLLSRERMDTNVVVLRSNANSPSRLVFSAESSAEGLRDTYITVIHGETKELITDVEITAFRPAS